MPSRLRAVITPAFAAWIVVSSSSASSAGPQSRTSQDSAARPTFEVASVKPNPADRACLFDILIPDHRVRARGCPIERLIRISYTLQTAQLVMLDRPVSGSYDLNATFADRATPTTRQDVLEMIQQLLAERFHLVAHRELRDVPIYALVLARKDGRLGKAMNRSAIDCEKWAAEGRSRTDEGVPSPLTPDHKRPACGSRPGPDYLVGGTTTITEMTTRLEVIVGRRVIDRTGLTGGFDFDLKFSRNPLAAPAADAAVPADDAPSIFTAIQEQLGLKLESTKTPLDVLVVDHVEPPTED
jgi:uncharacterized protein (TIGR03435 family)